VHLLTGRSARTGEPSPGRHLPLRRRSPGTAARVDRGSGAWHGDPGGLETLVQHDGFVAIYNEPSWRAKGARLLFVAVKPAQRLVTEVRQPVLIGKSIIFQPCARAMMQTSPSFHHRVFVVLSRQNGPQHIGLF
jgi:hypothetical protein